MKRMLASNISLVLLMILLIAGGGFIVGNMVYNERPPISLYENLTCSDIWPLGDFDIYCAIYNGDILHLITEYGGHQSIVAPVTKEKYDLEIMASDISIPFAIDFLPDGTPVVMESFGNLVFIGTDGIRRVNLNHNNSDMFFGMAVDPEFAETGYVYAFNVHNFSKGGVWNAVNRVTRFKIVDDELIEHKIIFDGIQFGNYQNAGGVRFGPDGKLYVTAADEGQDENSWKAQDNTITPGSILRINKDGTIPSDNPFGNAVYSYGHRNPQGLAWHPETKKLYSTEHGDTRMDEINLVEKGGNYGWPAFHCDIQVERVREYHIENNEPVFCFYSEEHPGKSNYYTVAPSGATFITNPRHPWYGSLFFASLRGQHLHRLILDENGGVSKDEIFLAGFGRIRDVKFNERDDSLYVITSNGDFTKKSIHENYGWTPEPVGDKLIKLSP